MSRKNSQSSSSIKAVKINKGIVRFWEGWLTGLKKCWHSVLMETSKKVSKIINGTYAGWTSMIQGFQIYFAWNPRLKGVEGPCWAAQPIQPESGQSRLNWLCFLAWPFHALQSKISCKMYLESLNHTCSPCIGSIDDFPSTHCEFYSLI